MLQHEGFEEWPQDSGYLSTRFIRRQSEKAGVSVFSIRIFPSGQSLNYVHVKMLFS